MADAIGANQAANDTKENKFFTPPPTKASQTPMWAAGMAMGDMMAEKFLEDPQWSAAIEKMDMDAEEFGDFLGSTMYGLLKEISKYSEAFKDDEGKEPAAAAVSMGM